MTKRNSGATGGGFSLTGISGGKVKVKAIRKEFTGPTQAPKGVRRPRGA